MLDTLTVLRLSSLYLGLPRQRDWSDNMEMRLCADCRHYEASPLTDASSNYDKCLRPNAVWAKVDVIRGEHRPAFCDQERGYTTRSGICGPDAKHWEPSMGYLKSVDDEEEPHVISF